MTMFHLEHTESTTFFTWDEIGCLCRALGFPGDLFKNQVQAMKDEIPYDERGLSMKVLQRMWDLNVMFKPLHRSFNMHTADWNVCSFTTALHVLTHKALSFQDLYNIRVAYMAYEHIDMKGMVLDKHTLLRTLKMCGRTIAPLKLVHRIKHMKGTFEEKGRIQLYEFFTLILWCDVYTSYSPDDMETSSGKEEELFRLVDFQRLLTHHDQRVAKQLDDTYLNEEWDFGMERLGPKEVFKEPVVNTKARVAQTKYHTKKYRHLKQEVGCSQKRVYRAHAGTIRSRPVSAPDLDEYRKVEPTYTAGSTTATQVYESVQRRLHSAPSRASADSRIERPILPEHRRVQTPQTVTPRDLTDVRLKMENLSFDMSTLDVRCELQVEKEMEFYIPGYMDKLANRRPEPSPVEEPEKKPIHWTSKIVNNLAYPAASHKPAHNKSCDARFRGWQKVSKRPGNHVILTSQTHPHTEHGKMYCKMEQTAMEPVQYLHPDYIIRHTPKSAVSPITKTKKTDTKTEKSLPPFDFKSLNTDELEQQNQNTNKPKVDLDFFHSKYLTGGESTIPEIEGNQLSTKSPFLPVDISATTDEKANRARKVLLPQTKYSADVQTKGEQDTKSKLCEETPIPYMEHSRPKIVGVGQMGTISLLESIQESRDLEEKFIEVEAEKAQYEKQDEANENENKGREENDEDEDDDDLLDAEECSKMYKLNLNRKTKSQESSEHKLKAGEILISMRKSKSAPTPSLRRKSPRKQKSLVKNRRVAKSPGLSRCKSAGERRIFQGMTVSKSVEGDVTASSMASSYQAGSSLSSHDQPPKFKAARGSVTSDEMEEVDCKDTKNVLRASKLVEESSGKRYVKIQDINDNMDEDDDASFYSDAMTLPSSTGITELESPTMRQSRMHEVPDISIDLEESMGSSIRRLDRRIGGMRVQFNSLGEMRPDTSSTFSPSDMRPNVMTSCSTIRINDGSVALTDPRDYLSDSGIDNKRLFSKQARSRLIGRVENAISPDLRMMILGDNNKISIPAS